MSLYSGVAADARAAPNVPNRPDAITGPNARAMRTFRRPRGGLAARKGVRAGFLAGLERQITFLAHRRADNVLLLSWSVRVIQAKARRMAQRQVGRRGGAAKSDGARSRRSQGSRWLGRC
jgi:hypothetical protein